MLREAAKFLYDIATACEEVFEFTRERTFEEFQNDSLLRSAVERQFITIGEALSQAIRVDPSVGVAISHTRLIIGFRNVLVHGYAVVSDATVWGVIEDQLATFEEEVRNLLATADDASAEEST